MSWQRDTALLTNPLIVVGIAVVLCLSLFVLEGAVALVSFRFVDELVLLSPQVLLVALGAMLVLLTLACIVWATTTSGLYPERQKCCSGKLPKGNNGDASDGWECSCVWRLASP